jgi:hypothetical protein
MDGSRFDDLTRALVTSRRGALRTIAAGLAAGLTWTRPAGAQTDDEEESVDREQLREEQEAEREAEQAAREAEREAEEAAREAEREAARAAREEQREQEEAEQAAEAAAREAEREAERAAGNAFQRAGRRCDRSQPCGSMAPCVNGICTPIACDVNGEIVAPGALNPENECQLCAPTVDSWTGWTGVVADGSSCTVASEDPCLSVSGACSAGECVAEPLPDGSPCGDEVICCRGRCCGQGECCSDGGACVPCGPHCDIEGVVYFPGPHPDHDCLECDPGTSERAWTPVDDDTACGTTAGRICCNGDCCAPDECCDPSGQCVDCGPHCRIGGQDLDPDDVNPDNECEICDPRENPSSWSPAEPGTRCGPLLGQRCCNGVCCPERHCCGNNGSCELCQCRIRGRRYDDGRANPANSCEYCNTGVNDRDWTPLSNQSICGENRDRVCCAGECCPAGECCTGGACGKCPCRIDGQMIPAGTVNSANRCLICDPVQNETAWTILDDGSSCGPNDDQVCCDGVCCAIGSCCTANGCQRCPCSIGGNPVPADTVNIDNPCLICDPARNRNGWSPREGDDIACGPDGEGECCEGECCPSDRCCTLGACGTCLCHIDGTNYAGGVTHPQNTCLYCDAREEELDWTARANNTACGVDRVCCGGACCEENQCCVLDACTSSCGCMIDGTPWGDQQRNPGNPCEICDPVLDPEGWSSLTTDNDPCGNAIDQVCCNGGCCPQGQCCDLQGRACVPCVCVIGDDEYISGAFNPENDCEYCNYAVDPIGWTLVQDDTPCGDEEGRICCRGTCCATGECCVEGACAACRCEIGQETWQAGVRNPANDCQECNPSETRTDWTTVGDGEPCGDVFGQICCNGACCESDECCVDGSCAQCDCRIDGEGYVEGEHPPDGNECLACVPSESITSFTPLDGEACGENGEGRCCNGSCCGAGECCKPDTQTCGECDCTIDGAGYNTGDLNPENGCEVCEPGLAEDAWSPVLRGACGEAGDRHCCDGVCCEPGECCSGNLVCEECACTIDETGYAAGAFNPGNVCQYCDPESSADAWSPYPGGRCGDDGSRACCDGECCDAGQCCDQETLFCGACACTIEEAGYNAGDPNPVNACEVCDPERSSETWSGESDIPCGENGDRWCCDGACCPDDQCCGPGTQTCGDCDCAIDGKGYPRGMLNPENACETCDPQRSEDAWSVVLLGPCGENDELECCDGVCCPAGQCCSLSLVCVECCSIDGEHYPDGAQNPESECQICDVATSRERWTLLDDETACGPNGDMICCAGICTDCECVQEEGLVAAASRIVCGPPCVIGGLEYQNGDPNPENACEVCDSAVSAETWTDAPFLTKCGGDGDRICCNGVCCPDGECCRPGFSSCSIEWCGIVDPCPYIDGPCGCTIEGQFYDHLDANPSNPCQRCDAYWSTTSWSASPNYFRCGALEDRFCCEGVCCETGSCCNQTGACQLGAPGCRGCVIGGRFFFDGIRNEADKCQICDVEQSTTSWSQAPNGLSCEMVVDDDGVFWGFRYCCEGVCCPSYADCCSFSNTCEPLPSSQCQWPN